MRHQKNTGPAGNGTGVDQLGGGSLTNISAPADNHSRNAATPANVFFRDCYAVLVRGKTVRRHLYFNLPAAERTVRRAHRRGDQADMILVRLVPVDARHLDVVEGEVNSL